MAVSPGLYYLLGGSEPAPPDPPGPTTLLPGTVGSFVYPLMLASILRGEFDYSDGNLRAQAVDGRISYDPAHEFVADLDVEGLLGASVAIEEVDVTINEDPPATFVRINGNSVKTPEVLDKPPAKALIILYGDGTPETTRLVAYLGRRIDSRQVTETTANNGIDWFFPNGIFTF